MADRLIPLDQHAQIARLHRLRGQRAELLGADLFADPAWDMLLFMALCHDQARAVCVTDLCSASHAPSTTALRYIGAMEELGLIERRPDPADRRRHWLALTEAAQQRLRHWFSLDHAKALV